MTIGCLYRSQQKYAKTAIHAAASTNHQRLLMEAINASTAPTKGLRKTKMSKVIQRPMLSIKLDSPSPPNLNTRYGRQQAMESQPQTLKGRAFTAGMDCSGSMDSPMLKLTKFALLPDCRRYFPLASVRLSFDTQSSTTSGSRSTKLGWRQSSVFRLRRR
jgi:hypothetical protein